MAAGDPTPVHRLLVDTDLGSDPDDLLALALVLGSPELELVGAVTVYGDVALRSRITRAALHLAGAGDVPVVSGTSVPLSGAEVWWAGHEGDRWRELLEPATVQDARGDGTAWAREQLTAAGPGAAVDVLAIGPLTDLASVLDDPAARAGVRHLWVMGGDFSTGAPGPAGSPGPVGSPGAAADGPAVPVAPTAPVGCGGGAEPEHNLRSDVVAARRVLGDGSPGAGPGVPTTVVGVEVTRRVRTTEDDRRAIAGAGPLGALVAAEMAAWWRRWQEPDGVPHDPLAVLLLVRPDLFVLSAPGSVVVDADGRSRHVPSPDGLVRVVLDVDAQGARAEVLRRVLAGCRIGGTDRAAGDRTTTVLE